MRFNMLSFIAILGTVFANADVGKVKVKNNCEYTVRYWMVIQTPPMDNGPFEVQPGQTSDGREFTEGGFDIKVADQDSVLSGPHIDWAMNVNKKTRMVNYDVHSIFDEVSHVGRVRIAASEGSKCQPIDTEKPSGGKHCVGAQYNFTMTTCYKD